jgi:hypothetical protein
MTIVDRSGPGVRITLLDNERAPSGEPLDLAGRIIAFTYEDAEKKADQVSLQLDNFWRLNESYARTWAAVSSIAAMFDAGAQAVEDFNNGWSAAGTL